MKKIICFLPLFLLVVLGGCATAPSSNDIQNDQPLVDIPEQNDQATAASTGNDDTGFTDVSFEMKRRYASLTNNAEIRKETDNYVKNGQADIITQPDGTILYPYGLAEVNLMAKKMMYSKIVLQEGEKIMSAAAGDTTRWNILPSYIGDSSSYTPVVLVKPFMGGLQTSLSIITDKRDYDITIQSVDSGDYMRRIGFYYPQDKADQINVGLPPDESDGNDVKQPKISLENIKFDYVIQGDRRLNWYPVKVFEDGNKVFIKMPEKINRSELPIFMAIDEAGQPEVVNYRYFRPYFVIDVLFKKGMLVIGTDKYQKRIFIFKKLG